MAEQPRHRVSKPLRCFFAQPSPVHRRDDLRASFPVDWSDRIEDLFQSYVTERALMREIEKNPFLATEIKDTDLPGWVKDALTDLPWCLNSVLDVLQFTKAELRNHRGVGERAMVIIENYLAAHGLQMRY